MKDIRIAFADGFFSALDKLTPSIQAKVTSLILKFKANPVSPGLNYETISAAKDKFMRSLRVDQAYRVILLAPESGNVYLLLWVDHHDDAYAWARRHRCQINPSTGTIQIYATEVKASVNSEAQTSNVTRPAFDKLKDKHLLALGIPTEQLGIVREVFTDDQLDSIQSLLPLEVYDALILYLAGDSYENIMAERDSRENTGFDTSNFAEALDRIQTQASFFVPESEHELLSMLMAPLKKWRVFLHSSQRRLVLGHRSGATCVLGGAGTGKTVVAIHRARWLAQQLQSDGSKILFVTFTRNLAMDIEQNLKSICSRQELSKIEVVNLDAWVQRFLNQKGYDFSAPYAVSDHGLLNTFWRQSLAKLPRKVELSEDLLKEEWQFVVQAEGCDKLEDYLAVDRAGRGTALSRAQRQTIWPVFEEYRHMLNRAHFREQDDIYRDATRLIAALKVSFEYRSVVVDEAQDMGTQAFKLLRAIVPEGPDDIFIVGDAHQRIYGRNKVILGRCGLNVRGRTSKLKINYRTTEEIRKWAVSLLDNADIDDLNGGPENSRLYRSLTHGNTPFIENFSGPEGQARFIAEILKSSDQSYARTCVVARTRRELDDIERRLNMLGVPSSRIEAAGIVDLSPNTVRMATVHRVKGLEFDQVVVASANEGLLPLDAAVRGKADFKSAEAAETEERSLMYVAVTRARKMAWILSWGSPSPFVTG